MASEILIYDYCEIDPYWGFEEDFVIGYGTLTAENIIAQIALAEGDLKVRINSQGGKVFDGWAIYNALKTYDKGIVTVQVDGIAASIASIIAMAGQTVTMMQASMMMIHKPTGFYIGAMDASELASEAQSLTEIEKVLVDVYVGKTGLGAAKLQSLIDAATWLGPDTAVALGFADRIEKGEAKPVIQQNVFDRLFTNTSESTRVYANSAFTIKSNNNMSTVKELAEKQDKTNGLLQDFLNLFKGDKKNEETVTTTETKEVTTEAPAEPTLEELKAENEKLKAEAAENKDKVDNAQSVLDKANELYTKMENTLAEVKSNYKAPEAGKTFDKSATAEPKERFKFKN